MRCADYASVGPATTDLRKMLRGAVADLDALIVPVPISAFGPSDADAIRETLDDLAERVDDHRGLAAPEDIVARAGDCCLVVTGSYHAAMCALSQCVSVVALI
ncbi:hypothetical protein ACKWRH_31015 [Bradyrhizobium sp. Pa8]|uniref:hypothetical protein n=1 Tax=Bradyrhizobium sp. Pa8 TaxID=3386552 RepID=UPI00403F6476